MFKRKAWYLMDKAGEGGNAGGSADPAAGTAEPGATGDPAPAAADPGTTAAASALADGKPVDQAAIPEKYQVKKEDGTLDIEASSLKLAEAYGHLEKRIGSGDLPPKTAEDYAVTVPAELEGKWDPATDELLAEFKKDALGAGLNQKQFDFFMGKYLEMAPNLVAGEKMLSADEAKAELRKEWKTDEVYNAEVGKAFQAAKAYGDADQIIQKYGNDPVIVKMLAKIGGELGEDKAIQPGDILSGTDSIDSLLASKAYTDPRDPDHARVSKQVAAYYAAQAKQREKTGSIPVI